MAKFKNVALFVLSIFMLVGVCSMSSGCLGGDRIKDAEQRIEELEKVIADQKDRIDGLEKENTNLSDRLQYLELQFELQAVKGNLCSLSKAYYLGLLSKDDLMSIFYYHHDRNGSKYNEDVLGADFIPAPKNPEVLCEETDNAIRQAYYSGKKPDNSDKTIEDVEYEYYGTYNNCVAVRLYWHTDGPIAESSWTGDIGDLEFKFTDWYELLIWVKN